MADLEPLQSLLQRYQTALECLNDPKNLISIKQALEILLARDAIQKTIETSQNPVDIIPRLIQLDSHLKKHVAQIKQVSNLSEWRESFPTTSQSWWWYLDTFEAPHSHNRLDWLWKGIRLGLWTVNFGLLGTLTTRFLSGGTGFFEIVTIAFPSILALLQAKSELTSTGQKGFNRLLNRLNIAPHWHEEAKLASTTLLFLFLVGIWSLQPQMAQYINREGIKVQKDKQLATAEHNYLRAISLDAENLNANYNLGTLYEDLQDADNARKYYLIAAKGGLPDAYNNLARLYILQQKYIDAVLLLDDGLQAIAQQEKTQPHQDIASVKYSLLKNLGWANLKLNQTEEAKDYLTTAISLAENQKSIRNSGSAYCLYAQVLEQENSPKLAMDSWKQCRSLIDNQFASGETITPEAYTWLYLAKKKLRASQP